MFKRRYAVLAAGFLLLSLFAVGMLPRGGTSAAALTNCTTSEDGINAAEQQMLTLINGARAAAGLNTLKLSPNLNRASAWKSADSGSNGLGTGFSHTDSLGRAPTARAQDCGYASQAAENIAYGSTSPDVIFGMWMGSSGHKANILTASYKVIGIGQHGSAWTTDFGFLDDSGSVTPATNTPTSAPPATSTGAAAAPTSTAIPASTSTPTRTPAAPATPAPTSAPRVLSGVSMVLSAGINLVTYAGEPQLVSAGLQGLQDYVLAVYQWDASRGVWERYIPGGPGYVNSFSSLEAGRVYYIQVIADVIWTY
ncbi:MAG: CAP domain-containing protein [Anaerolineaceae bacterium]